MPRTHYLGRTSTGYPVGRGSKEAYGYTHAAVLVDAEGKPRVQGSPSFSRTERGAQALAEQRFPERYRPEGCRAEVVPVAEVDASTYRRAMAPKDERAAKADRLQALAGEPVLRDSRICFGIAYFDTEAKAEAFGALQQHLGSTYNGGMFHGMACRRDSTWDHTPTEGPHAGRKLYGATY